MFPPMELLWIVLKAEYDFDVTIIVILCDCMCLSLFVTSDICVCKTPVNMYFICRIRRLSK